MVGEKSTKDVCEEAVNVAYQVVEGYDHDAVVNSICSEEAVQAIDKVFETNSMPQLTGQVCTVLYQCKDTEQFYVTKHPAQTNSKNKNVFNFNSIGFIEEVLYYRQLYAIG